jgi:hypothetical protein
MLNVSAALVHRLHETNVLFLFRLRSLSVMAAQISRPPGGL